MNAWGNRDAITPSSQTLLPIVGSRYPFPPIENRMSQSSGMDLLSWPFLPAPTAEELLRMRLKTGTRRLRLKAGIAECGTRGRLVRRFP